METCGYIINGNSSHRKGLCCRYPARFRVPELRKLYPGVYASGMLCGLHTPRRYRTEERRIPKTNTAQA